MATIASLVVSIGADIAQLKTGVDAAGNKIDSFASKASRAFDALKGAAAFGAVAAMVSTVADAIDEIDGISATINDTAENVQRLQAVSESFDVEMTAIVGAIQEMERGLANGKIEGALAAINIEVADFQSMAPSQRYVEVAEALAQVEDRSLQVELAQQLFGKAWKSNIAAIREGVSEVDRWIKISDETVETMDRLGISWANIKASAVNFTATVIDNIFQLSTLVSAYDNARDGINRLFMSERNYVQWKASQNAKDLADLLPASPAPGAPSAPSMPSEFEWKRIHSDLDETIKRQEKMREAAEKVRDKQAEANEKFRESVSIMATAAGNWRMWQQFAVGAIDSATQAAFEFDQAFRQVLTAIDLSARGWEPFKQGIKDSGDELEKLHAQLKQVATWKDIGQRLSGAIIGAIQGGGSIGKALGGEAGQMLGTKLGNTVGNWAGKAIGGSLGAAIGGAAGSVLPVVGTMLGSVAGSFIGKLFGGGNQDKKQIQTAMQGLDFANLRAKADELGISMDRVFSAKKVDDFKNAVAGVTAQIDEQEKLQQRGIAAMERYGITIEQAGAKFKQTQMTATAQSLVEDFHALVAVGVDTDTIIQKMGGSIGAFIHRSIEMGTQVPREMEPIIAKMIETGSLVDKNGEKFTELGQIPWMDSPIAAMQKLMDKIGALIDLIGDGITGAINRLPKETGIRFKLNVDASDLDRYSIDGEFPKMAKGGIVTQPTIAMIGEAGPEAVVPLSQLRGAGARSGGENHIHIHGGVFDGYTSEVSFARRVLDVLSQEGERRGRGLAFGAA